MSLDDFAGEPGVEEPFDGLDPATVLGHVQLKVTDHGLAATEPFYCDLLGLDVTARVGDSFLGVGLSDFRTLLVFTSRFSADGAEPAPVRSAQLIASSGSRRSPRTTVDAFRHSMEFLQEGALDSWLALFDDNAVLEFPFAPPGAPSRVEGKTALSDHVKAPGTRPAGPSPSSPSTTD
jgi:catechol 2,3-dioxygenase-like lactoylglutathione lyase family enzyme